MPSAKRRSWWLTYCPLVVVMLLFFEMIHMQKGNFASMDQPQESTQGHVGGSHTVASMDRKKPSPSSTISLNSDAVDRLLAKVAIANYSGLAAFYFNQKPGLSGAGSLTEGKLAAKRFPDHPSTMTEVATLDSLVDRVKPNATIPFLKVAARGWELEALHGAIRSLQRTHMVWFAHSHHWRSSLNAAVEFLQTLGFVTFLISHDGLVRLNAPYWDPIYDSISGEQQVLALQASSPLLQKRRLGIFCVNPLPKTPGM